jgi:uncharacterized protein involved in exopolysaccharide biosynthesis
MEVAISSSDITILEQAVEISELRQQLAEAQDQCIEMAVDAGHLHAEIGRLRRDLAAAEGRPTGALGRTRHRRLGVAAA